MRLLVGYVLHDGVLMFLSVLFRHNVDFPLLLLLFVCYVTSRMFRNLFESLSSL